MGSTFSWRNKYGFWSAVVDLKAGAIASGFELGAAALQFREWTVQRANIRKLKMAGFEVNRKYWVFGREIRRNEPH